jgi:hypothetical protein
MVTAELISRLGEEVEDADEGTSNFSIPISYQETLTHKSASHETETFLLFAQDLPSHNLGFVDPKAQSLAITVAGRDFTIYQSPGILASSRAGGTTGAGKQSSHSSVLQ